MRRAPLTLKSASAIGRIAAVVLLLLWILGLATGRTMGGFVHVLFVDIGADQSGSRKSHLGKTLPVAHQPAPTNLSKMVGVSPIQAIGKPGYRPSRPWRNCSCFVTCDEACGNGKMIRGADQRRH